MLADMIASRKYRYERGALTGKSWEQYLMLLGRKNFPPVHARCKLSEVGSCNFRWNEIYTGRRIFFFPPWIVRVLSLSVYGRFVSFIGSNGLDKWLKLHRKFVRIQFHWRKRNENYIYIYIWNFKNLQFDGIASKVCSGRWCPLAE